MDPRQAWLEIVSLAVDLNNAPAVDWDVAEELANRVLDLRDWFNGGGFVPANWTT